MVRTIKEGKRPVIKWPSIDIYIYIYIYIYSGFICDKRMGGYVVRGK